MSGAHLLSDAPLITVVIQEIFDLLATLPLAHCEVVGLQIIPDCHNDTITIIKARLPQSSTHNDGLGKCIGEGHVARFGHVGGDGP